MPPRKIWDIDDPPVVVLVGRADDTAALAAELESGTEYRVERIVEPARAVDRLGRRPAVECCWLAVDPQRGNALDLVADLGDADPVTAVVCAPTSGSEALAAGATAAGASDYVAEAATAEERRERVERAVDRAIDRRHDAVKRSMLDSLVDDLDVNVFAKDEQARHLVHPRDVTTVKGEELFGLTDPQVFGTAEDTLVESYRDDLAVVRDGERIAGKLEHYPDFQEGWQLTSKVPWDRDGERRGLVGLTMEVSEWKHRERELLQQVGYLQRIPKYLTHDLRNPLAIARGYVQLAREGEPGALDTVEDSLDRMSRKLTEFHGLVGKGEVTDLARKPVQFVPIVEDVWGHVTLPGADLEIDSTAEATILADEDQFRPLLQNLFRNAIDHAGPNVDVRIELTDDGFRVEDDGPGLAGVEDEDLFATGATTDANAPGLGLAIVREVAHLHGWEVETGESDRGGAAFTFSNAVVGRPTDAAPTEERLRLDDAVDVGDVAIQGSARIRDDVVTIRSAGENVWGNINEFHFVYAEVTGDVRLETRVAGMDVATDYSKAGVMVRSGLEETAAYGSVCRLADRYPELLWRSAPGDRGDSAQAEGVEDRTDRIAIERVGGDVVTSIAATGDAWTPIDRRPVELGDEIAVGLFVCSTAADESVEAIFEDVTLRRRE